MTTRTRSVADLEVIATMDGEIERLRRELRAATAKVECFRKAHVETYEAGREALVTVNSLRTELRPLRAELDATKSKLACVESARQMLDRRVAELRYAESKAVRMASEIERLNKLLDAARELMRRKTTKVSARKPKKKKGTR